ncbi:MAG TPA: hypothetical protein VKR58_04165 [Aquella sp.]|nr:hypothetical protein [Aquella sp.]
MKKLLLVLLASTSIAYAAGDCSEGAQKVVSKLAAHNKTSVTLSYSPDQKAKAETCQTAIVKLNPKVTVNMTPVEGNGIFKFSR